MRKRDPRGFLADFGGKSSRKTGAVKLLINTQGRARSSNSSGVPVRSLNEQPLSPTAPRDCAAIHPAPASTKDDSTFSSRTSGLELSSVGKPAHVWETLYAPGRADVPRPAFSLRIAAIYPCAWPAYYYVTATSPAHYRCALETRAPT